MGILNRFKKKKDEGGAPEAVEQKPRPVIEGKGKRVGIDATNVIVKPLISEKAATLSSANQYVFIVRKDANRVAVRMAIKAMYGVSPISVNILNVQGKQIRFGRREGKRSDWKKAVVTLPEGQSINVYEGV